MSIFHCTHNLPSLWNSINFFFISVQGSFVPTVKLYFDQLNHTFFDCSDYVKHFRLDFMRCCMDFPSPLSSQFFSHFFSLFRFFLHTLNNFPIRNLFNLFSFSFLATKLPQFSRFSISFRYKRLLAIELN